VQGSQLKYLAAVTDLAALDIQSAPLTLQSEASGRFTAFYAGAYAHGRREAEGDAKPFLLSVNAGQFKTFAAMFRDEDQIRINPTETGLSISSANSRVHMTRNVDIREDDLNVPSANEAEFAVKLSASTLISEVEAASAFISTSHVQPIFQGVRLDFNEDGLRVTAYDGSSTFYQSHIKARVKADAPGYITLPWEDFLKGARLIGDGTATLIKSKKEAVYIFNKTALFRTSILVGKWPDTSKLTEQRNTTHFKVDAAQLRDLVNSAKALVSDRSIEVEENKGRVLFKTESEFGSFVTSIRGHLTAPLKYDVESLGKVVKLGPVLDFYVPEQAWEPTIVECDDRRCWIMTRV